MIIAQISDMHLLKIGSKSKAGHQRVNDLKATVAQINAMADKIDAVINTGDLCNEADEDRYQQAHLLLGNLVPPHYAVPGNRDHRVLFLEVFGTAETVLPGAPFAQYAVDFKQISVIGLDTQSDLNMRGDFCERRLQHLEIMLNERKHRPVLLFMHHPPIEVPSLKRNHLQFDAQAAEKLLGLLASHKNIGHIFCGHTHMADELTAAGIPLNTMPAVATGLRLGEGRGTYGVRPLFYLHQVDELGRVSTKIQYVSDDLLVRPALT